MFQASSTVRLCLLPSSRNNFLQSRATISTSQRYSCARTIFLFTNHQNTVSHFRMIKTPIYLSPDSAANTSAHSRPPFPPTKRSRQNEFPEPNNPTSQLHNYTAGVPRNAKIPALTAPSFHNHPKSRNTPNENKEYGIMVQGRTTAAPFFSLSFPVLPSFPQRLSKLELRGKNGRKRARKTSAARYYRVGPPEEPGHREKEYRRLFPSFPFFPFFLPCRKAPVC